jgi:DNA-binding transcriptional ArsR family regulator
LTTTLSKDTFRSVPPTDRTVKLTDPRALRALAHPTRVKLVGLLRREGPLTATQAGALIDEVPASASFHLRQLAKYGLVEEAPGGRGRERPWRATASFTSWSSAGATPAMAIADQMLSGVIAERYMEQLMGWLDSKPDQPPEWQRAALFGDMPLYVTAAELEELGTRLGELLDPYLGRVADPETRPEGARLVTLIQLAFPTEAADAR